MDAAPIAPAGLQAAEVRALRVVAVLLAVLVVSAPGAGSTARPADVGSTASPRLASEPEPARTVLQRLLRKRAAAYARGDPAALRDVFVSGSSVLRRDQALMRAWSRRGLTVRGAVVLVRSVHVLDAPGGRVVLRTIDRLGPVHAVGVGRFMALPRDRLSRHRIVLVRRDVGWRIAAVRALSG